MKIRRRFAAGTLVDRVGSTIADWWGRVRRRDPAPSRGAGSRRAPGPTHPWRHFLWLAGGLVVLTVVAGYLLAALVLFPAPIFAASLGVPSVLGVPADEAETTLRQANLLVNIEDTRLAHGTIPSGAVVWQDPPPEVVVPEGTEIHLTLSAGPQRVPVPDVAGYDAALARTLLESAGLTVGSIEQTQAPTPENVAVNTRPPAGSTLLPGTRVTLVVSIGAPTIRVPTLVGLSLDSARVLLEERGLSLGENYFQTNVTVPPGQIFFQNPAAGTLTAPGTAVNVRLAREEP